MAKKKVTRKTKAIQISLPIETLNRLSAEAEEMGVNKSSYIRYCLSQVWQGKDIKEVLPEFTNAMNSLVSELKRMGK